VFIESLSHGVHETAMLLRVLFECILCDVCLFLVSNEDANPVIDVLHWAVLTSLVSGKLAKYWCVLVLEEVHVIEWVLVTIAPIQLEWMDNNVLRFELALHVCCKCSILTVYNISRLNSLSVILNDHCFTYTLVQISSFNPPQQGG